MRDSLLGPFFIIRLKGENEMEVKLTEEFSKKNPVFPVSLIKKYWQTGEHKVAYRNKSNTPQDIVEVEEHPCQLKNITKARKIRLNNKDHRQYLVKFKKQTSDKDKWMAEDLLPDGKLHLRILRASRRAEKSH
ncbi:hypothetical protein O181_028455 [Austropuccinia psidii MF-1]|uniref:Uncharacterized protein n=1 Tax=Austropuccinia psidii MF-1 TaxID=1389203 RepID=A0A9Q3H472_9BASI|nr:hypothetical protein [Austropuccinia psidii MF-1]